MAKKKKILLVEDEDKWRSHFKLLIENIFTRKGVQFSLTSTNNILDAMELLNNSYDLIVTDICIQHDEFKIENGDNQYGLLLVEEAKEKSIPCIVVSGTPNIKTDDVPKIIYMGATYFRKLSFDDIKFQKIVYCYSCLNIKSRIGWIHLEDFNVVMQDIKKSWSSGFDEVNIIERLDDISVSNLLQYKNEKQIDISLRKIKIFLASSFELKNDRDEFDLYLRQKNDQLIQKGIYLEIIRWENDLDAMSETRLQDEYNNQIRACDIFVCLFFTKTGTYTEEEFYVAHQHFKMHSKPVIYTFFKNAQIKTGNAKKEDMQSIWRFQDMLNELGHYYTKYDNVEHLKRQFRDQLDKLEFTRHR